MPSISEKSVNKSDVTSYAKAICESGYLSIATKIMYPVKKKKSSIIYSCNWGQKKGRKVYSDHNAKQF